MPRRLPIRTVKIMGNFFVLIVALTIGTIYYTFMAVWAERVNGKKTYTNLTFLLL